jgi:DNA polymerase V
VIALVDCDNFYASCEAVFHPRLRGKPLVVLSNRDTCVVARSAEAKALGIPMAVPVFSVRDVIAKNGVTLLSSNYALYADMSRRVAEALASLCPDIEKYSVDESFLDLSGLSGGDGLALGRALRERVRLWTGIPVSVGLAATKTLAKVAARFAKRRGGVFAIDARNVDEALCRTPIENVWGVAERRAELLRRNGIRNAREFRDAPDGWLRERLGIVWLRLAQELRGEPRIPLEFAPPPHKTTATNEMSELLPNELSQINLK